ncbi:UTRA domain-containing protein [Streptomyces sp. AC1-42W]|uniref:UTRA domain-containing protein n=1 Tax=Streptomyces sp. AC1-42W TaxID=2218666 RepID=UPI000DAB480E|nr:UTRA domain-containing protein [Streptomyces sp. AC1-42W]
MADQGEAQTWSTRAQLGAVELPPGAPAGTVRMVTGTRARRVNEQEAHDFGISTDRACLEIEQIFYDADDDVLRHTITVDYSGQPHVTRHVPTAEELARRE